MADSVRPEDIAGHSFTTGWRGYQTAEVDRFLDELARRVADLSVERDALRNRLRELGDRDLRAEFETVSAQIAEILQTAREAAEGMRKRASIDAEEIVAAAEAAAFSLRQDAWMASEALILDVQAEADRLIEAAKHDALRIISDAERDSHRRTATARKEAEDVVRLAKLEADRVLVEARGRGQVMIEQAQAKVEEAKGKVEAAVRRRRELAAAIEKAEATLERLNGEVAGRESEIEKVRRVDTSTVRVFTPETTPVRIEPKENTPAKPEAGQTWESGGERIRIVPAPPRIRPASDDVDAEKIADEVRSMRTPSGAATPPVEPETASEPQAESVEDTTGEPAVPQGSSAPAKAPPVDNTEPAAETSEPTEEAVDVAAEPADIDDLFARLRAEATAGGTVERDAGGDEIEEAAEDAETLVPVPDEAGGADLFELRDRLLLPITNKALRTLKRNLTEAQNVALDELRVEEEAWNPDPAVLEERISEELDELVTRSASAGWEASARVLGVDEFEPVELPELESPAGDLAEDLVAAVRAALEGATDAGPRRRAAAVSRVYRGWRVDEAERRVRDVAIGAYHDGLLAGFRRGGVQKVRWVLSGRGCITCRAMTEVGKIDVGSPFGPGVFHPPAHEGCACTLRPA